MARIKVHSLRYWYHPESDALWTSRRQEIGDGLVVELTRKEYEEIMERLKQDKERRHGQSTGQI